jgi:hypothetical protein
MINFGESSMGCWEECTLYGCWMKYSVDIQLGPFDLWCDLVLECLYWVFCLDDLSIGDRKVLKLPITTVCGVCLMKLSTLTLGAYRLIIIVSFWYISPFISMKSPSSSFLINLGLKSTLCEISIGTPVCFQGPLAW